MYECAHASVKGVFAGFQPMRSRLYRVLVADDGRFSLDDLDELKRFAATGHVDARRT
jgi:ureidoglycolate hydrolase